MTTADERSELRAAAAGVVAGFGAFFVVRHLSTLGGDPFPIVLYDAPFVLLSASMLYAGYWLLRCDFDHRRVSRVALWSLAGLLVLVAVVVWASNGRAEGVQDTARLVLNVGTVGASSGLLVGLEGERRRRHSDRDARLAVERAEERLGFFNRLLRHHLLNGIAVVSGNAELLADAYEDPPDAVDVIRRRCDEIVDLVENVETLSRAFTGDMVVRAVDPGLPLVNAVESVRADGAVVELRGDHRNAAPVLASDRIDLVFEAVLAAAIEAADGDRIAVDTAQEGDEFVVSFAFDGSLSEDSEVRPGEHGDEHLELFLAETLLEFCGGSLDLRRGERGSVLALRLPRAG